VRVSRELLLRAQNVLVELLKSAGRSQEAEQVYRQAVNLYEKVMADHPAVAEYQQELATAYKNLGTFLTDDARRQEGEKAFGAAVAAYEKAATVYAKLVSKFPNESAYKEKLASAHRNAGALLRSTGQVQQAEQAYRQSVELYESLLADPRNAGHGFWLSMSYLELHHMLAAAGRADEADTVLDRARAYLERRAAEFRDTPAYRHELGRIHNWAGIQLAKRGRHREAEQAHRRALDLYKQLRQQNTPHDEMHRREFAWTCMNLGLLLENRGRAKEAEQAYREALALYRKLAAERPADAEYPRWTAQLAAQLGQTAEAEKAFGKAIELSPDESQLYYLRALVRVWVGDLAGYRHACAAMLARFGQTDRPEVAHWVAWTAVLAPDAVKELGRPVKMAESALRSAPTNHSYGTTTGAALYRAGRFTEAVARLNESGTGKPTLSSLAYTWFFLAMAHERLGHAGEAGQWLDKAIKCMEQETRDNNPAWNRRLTLQLLRREAEALIKPAGAKPPTPADH
jgi:tetratricopeptide (TPR) repeat protein